MPIKMVIASSFGTAINSFNSSILYVFMSKQSKPATSNDI